MTHDCCQLTVTGRPARTPRVRAIDPCTFATCYLCGNTISSDSSHDHVPPKQFFPRVFRNANTTDQLEWLPTHTKCNRSYQPDEDYFVATFGLPAAASTLTGHALGHDIRDRYRTGRQQGLVTKVLNEFVQHTNIKGFDSGRTHRVAWKIARGLHTLRTGQVLPERARVRTNFTCDKTRALTRDLDTKLAANGFHDSWEGLIPNVFKAKILVDEQQAATSYSYVIVCWEYLTYFFLFAIRDGELIESAI